MITMLLKFVLTKPIVKDAIGSGDGLVLNRDPFY